MTLRQSGSVYVLNVTSHSRERISVPRDGIHRPRTHYPGAVSALICTHRRSRAMIRYLNTLLIYCPFTASAMLDVCISFLSQSPLTYTAQAHAFAFCSLAISLHLFPSSATIGPVQCLTQHSQCLHLSSKRRPFRNSFERSETPISYTKMLVSPLHT